MIDRTEGMGSHDPWGRGVGMRSGPRQYCRTSRLCEHSTRFLSIGLVLLFIHVTSLYAAAPIKDAPAPERKPSSAYPAMAGSTNFYLHANGITIMCPKAQVGDSGRVNGVRYTKRSVTMMKRVLKGNPAALVTTCTTNVTDLSNFFKGSGFNENIRRWDTSQVTNMRGMFRDTFSFNQPIGNWDTSQVTDMSHMFRGALRFDQPIGYWDTSQVTNMRGMFRDTHRFNQPVENWDTSQVTDIGDMFRGAMRFDQRIRYWDTSQVTNMRGIFKDALQYELSFDEENDQIVQWILRILLFYAFMGYVRSRTRVLFQICSIWKQKLYIFVERVRSSRSTMMLFQIYSILRQKIGTRVVPNQKNSGDCGQITPLTSSMDEEPFRAPEIYSTANQREEPGHTRYLNHKEQQEVDSSEITLGRELGQGSYGIVYQGTWHGVVIAVKRIRPPQGTPWSSVDRELLVRVFKEQVQPEVHIMSTVRHPFVVGCYGCCVDPPSILLELCPRGALGHMLQKCHEERALRDLMSWRQRLCMLRQVASAMRFLHSKNVLHRDLRAMNVVIAQDMTAKVSDVGLGKFVDEVSSRSAGTLGKGGNPRWLAPELVSENQPFTRACDVYGFGTIIWEMMEWRLPWEGMSEVHIIRDILQGRSLKVAGKSRWGSLPGPAPHHSRTLAQLSSLASKCMHSKPSARPSFADIVQTLLRLEEKEPQGQPLRQQHDDASSNALNRPPVCCICIDVDANTIISGCGHLCLCQGCSQTGQVTCCPICRAPGLPQRIYFA